MSSTLHSRLLTVDAIVPTKDRPTYLAEALASIRAVAIRINEIAQVNIVVVDDGTDAETAAVAARYGAQWMRNTGQGLPAARNTGIRASSGEFVTFLDDDDVWLDRHLAPHLAILQARREVAMVYAQGVLGDARLRAVFPPAPAGPLPSGDVFAYFLGQCMQCNTVVVRRAVLEDVGMFDEALDASEDWDLFLRIASRYDCAGVEAPVTLYRQSAANAKDHRMWRRQMALSLDVVRKWSRIRARSEIPLRQRMVLTFAIRGWFAYRLSESAHTFLRRGDRAEALRCLSAALMASPLHATLRIPGFWSALLRSLAGFVLPSRPRGTSSIERPRGP